VVLIAHADSGGGEGNAPVGEIDRTHIMVRSVGELPQPGAVGLDLIQVPPGVLLSPVGEDHAVPVVRDLGLGNVTVGECGEWCHYPVGLWRPQHVEVPPRPVGRSAVGGDVSLSPVITLVVVGHGVVALDEHKGVRDLRSSFGRLLRRDRRRRLGLRKLPPM